MHGTFAMVRQTPDQDPAYRPAIPPGLTPLTAMRRLPSERGADQGTCAVRRKPFKHVAGTFGDLVD